MILILCIIFYHTMGIVLLDITLYYQTLHAYITTKIY